MGFINASPFIDIVDSYRLVWVGGRFGGGKTSFCYALAENWLKRGYSLISNNKSVWTDDLNKVHLNDQGMLHSVVLLDEGGLYFNETRKVKMIASYAAKMDCIYLIPSFWPPVRSAQILICQPVFSLRSSGIPMIFYRWRVKIAAFEDKGFFAWVNPSEIYGIYSRQDPGDTATQIIEKLVIETENYRKYHGRKSDTVFDLEEGSEAAIIQDAAESFAETADTISSLSFGKAKRRRGF